ncbi:MAG: hypothetical protein NC095_11510 [Muribaculum sp.]|nr:hypothetical protein [Muribaculum sp.]
MKQAKIIILLLFLALAGAVCVAEIPKGRIFRSEFSAADEFHSLASNIGIKITCVDTVMLEHPVFIYDTVNGYEYIADGDSLRSTEEYSPMAILESGACLFYDDALFMFYTELRKDPLFMNLRSKYYADRFFLNEECALKDNTLKIYEFDISPDCFLLFKVQGDDYNRLIWNETFDSGWIAPLPFENGKEFYPVMIPMYRKVRFDAQKIKSPIINPPKKL